MRAATKKGSKSKKLYYACRQEAPYFAKNLQAIWPIVSEWDWCGKFKPKAE